LAINIDYSPISSALGLAQQAGHAQRQRTVAAQDMQFVQMMQQAQQQADQEYANEIRLGQEQDQRKFSNDLAVQNQKRLAEEAANNVLHQNAQTQVAQQNANTAAGNLQSNAAYRNGNLDLSQQRYDLSQQKYDTQQGALDNLPDDVANMIRANGHMPGQAQQGNQGLAVYKAIEAEAQRVSREVARFDAMKAKTVDGMLGRPVADPPDVAALRQRLQQLNGYLQKQSDLLQSGGISVGGQQPAVNPQAVQQIIAAQQAAGSQTAPAQQPRFVQTATNPQTGEKLGQLPSGQWVRIG
jgi:hypothetical protein